MIFNKVYGVQRGSAGPTVLLDTKFTEKDPSWVNGGYTTPFTYDSTGLSVADHIALGTGSGAVANPRTGSLDTLQGGYVKITLPEQAKNWALQGNVYISSDLNQTQIGGGLILLRTKTDHWVELSIEDSQANAYSWYKRVFVDATKYLEYGATGTAYKTGEFTINATMFNGTLKVQDPTMITYVNLTQAVGDIGDIYEVYIYMGDCEAVSRGRTNPRTIFKSLKISKL